MSLFSLNFIQCHSFFTEVTLQVFDVLICILLSCVGWYEGRPYSWDQRQEPSLPWGHRGCPAEG